ncbi:MAG: DNA methyltransferase, partial [Leptotrichiaceae bacterium]
MKNIIEENEKTTVNTKEIEILKKHFPNCFNKDGEFQMDKFEKRISQEVDVTKEGYELRWLGKNYARLLANVETETMIVDDKEHNDKVENKNSENIYIEGDNIDVLKHLKNAYSEKIKMIYIDPPYNTGSDGFVYKDDRKYTKEDLAELTNITEEEAQRILSFNTKGSNSHSAWLTFMYPRLLTARELLSDDGVIFISIDDNEVSQLKLLCDEVFGEENFVAELIWKKKNVVQNDAKYFSTDHEYLLCYTNNITNLKFNLLSRTKEQESKYLNPDYDPRGEWSSVALQAKSGNNSYQITFPNGVFWEPTEGTYPRLSKESLIKAYDQGRLW